MAALTFRARSGCGKACAEKNVEIAAEVDRIVAQTDKEDDDGGS